MYVDLSISVALAAATLVLGIAAIGGDTWNSAGKNLWKRLTTRGKFSAGAVLLIFGLTVVQGFRAIPAQEKQQDMLDVLVDQPSHLGESYIILDDTQYASFMVQCGDVISYTVERITDRVLDEGPNFVAYRPAGLFYVESKSEKTGPYSYRVISEQGGEETVVSTRCEDDTSSSKSAFYVKLIPDNAKILEVRLKQSRRKANKDR